MSTVSPTRQPMLVSIANLLKFSNATFSDETLYNHQESKSAPHCCICSVFVEVSDGTIFYIVYFYTKFSCFVMFKTQHNAGTSR